MQLQSLCFVACIALLVPACAKNASSDVTTTGGNQGGTGLGGAGGEGGVGGVGAAGMGGEGGGEVCEEDPCKLLLPQCGCDEGLKCSVNSEGKICTQAGTAPLGQVCDETKDCTAGSICVVTSNNVPKINTCHLFCETNADCAAPGGQCILELKSDGVPIPGGTLCTQNCDPTTNLGCPVAGTACQVSTDPDTMSVYSHCLGEGLGVQGDPCLNAEECAQGYGCFEDPAILGVVCQQWCKVNGNSDCPLGTECTAFDPPLQLGSANYGVCR